MAKLKELFWKKKTFKFWGKSQTVNSMDILETLLMVHLTSSIFQINNIMTELKELF